MVISCVVFGCKNRQGSCDANVSFHRFPHKNSELLKLWITRIRRRNWEPTKYSRLCSSHFKSEDFTDRSSSKNKYLKKNAVPSVFSYFTSSIYEPQKERQVLQRFIPEVPTDCDTDIQIKTENSTSDNKLENSSKGILVSENFLLNQNVSSIHSMSDKGEREISKLENIPPLNNETFFSLDQTDADIQIKTENSTSENELENISEGIPVSKNSLLIHNVVSMQSMSDKGERELSKLENIPPLNNETPFGLDQPGTDDFQIKTEISTSENELENSCDGIPVSKNFLLIQNVVSLQCMSDKDEREISKLENIPPLNHKTHFSLDQPARKKKTISPTEVKLRGKIRALQAKIRRQKKKILNMKGVIDALKNKGQSENLINIIKDNFSGFPQEFILNQLKSTNIPKNAIRYTNCMRQFATTVFSYSPKTYNFLRPMFQLPHPSLIRKWVSSVNKIILF